MKIQKVTDLYVQCAYVLREPGLAMSDCCRRPATSAVEDPYGGLYYYRCPEHEGLFRGTEPGRVVYELLVPHARSKVAVAELNDGDVLVDVRTHPILVEQKEWISHGRVRIWWHHLDIPGITGETVLDDHQKVWVDLTATSELKHG